MDCHAFEFMQRALQDLRKTACSLDARVSLPRRGGWGGGTPLSQSRRTVSGPSVGGRGQSSSPPPQGLAGTFPGGHREGQPVPVQPVPGAVLRPSGRGETEAGEEAVGSGCVGLAGHGTLAWAQLSGGFPALGLTWGGAGACTGAKGQPRQPMEFPFVTDICTPSEKGSAFLEVEGETPPCSPFLANSQGPGLRPVAPPGGQGA